ncbi:MAG TPA: hypothetical protein DEP35_21590 [Deltaproteobacteria bacterium]|jgi:uncharacterized OB-fold protein|nr:hypothetical protein [Deltaproteobacteria bacterium]
MPMEVVRGRSWGRPELAPGPLDHAFFEAAARGELWYQRCPACGHAQFYPRALCTACGGNPVWATASGRGVVHSFTIVRQNGQPPFKDELPYAVAMIELEEGVRMMGNVTDCPVESVRIGMSVEAYAVECGDGLAVPFWRPAASP